MGERDELFAHIERHGQCAFLASRLRRAVAAIDVGHDKLADFDAWFSSLGVFSAPGEKPDELSEARSLLSRAFFSGARFARATAWLAKVDGKFVGTDDSLTCDQKSALRFVSEDHARSQLPDSDVIPVFD